ncbi:MAG: sugar ABC transporter substrate-binding protein [Treponema sp.]|jgi:ribose transport system substrate-binding protein|nr:sugar ABC transporter substrate-binding protein [Treponema sp.]
MKKVITICFLALLAAGVLFTGCKREKQQVKQQARTFGFTCFWLGNPYFIILEQTIREEVEKNGDRLITFDPDRDRAKQVTQIEDMITQKIDVLFLNPVDLEAIRPALVSLNKANIPVINFDSQVKDLDLVAAYVGSDNRNAGYICGVDMVKRLPKGGPIAIFDSPARISTRDRIDGFKEAIMGNGFTIVFLRDAQGNVTLAKHYAEEMLKFYPEVIAFMGSNDVVALAAYAAFQSAGRDDILIYGVDGSPAAKAEIAKRGQFAGSGAQSPISIAKESTAVAYKILNKEPYEKRIPVMTFIINQENIDEYDINGWQ